MLLWLICMLPMLFISNYATAQTDFTGSFNTFLFQEIVSHMPGSGSNGYQPPTQQEIDDFGQVFEYMKSGNYSAVQPILDQYGYQFYRFHHTGENPDTFYLIYEPAPITRGWGMYVIRENFDRNVHVQVPHPLFDINTPQVGARSFVRHRMRFYSIAGAHRFSNGPQGTNPVSDVARDHPSIFQRAHEVWAEAEALQLHGFNDSNPIYDGYPDVVISNGTIHPQPVLYTLADLLEERNIPAGVYDENTMNDLSLLAATQNPQGQWSAANGHTFIHYEMARYLRELGDYNDMSTPINTVISTFGIAFQDAVPGGIIYVGEPGSAPGNQNPDYSSLEEAFQFLSSRELDGDLDVVITSDLTETGNVFIGTNTAGYELTIRPLEGVVPTVTFAGENGNSSINGALVIGAEADNWSQLRKVKNLTIQGGNGEAGSSENMTFRTSNNAAATNYIRILHAENLQIRNLNIEINQPSFEAVLITNLRRDQVDYLVSDVVFDKVNIKNKSRSSARAIAVRDAFERPLSPPGLLTIKSSLIEASRYGLWLREFGGDTRFHNNEIRIHENDGFLARGVFIEDTATGDVKIEIFNNEFSRLSARGQLYGIEIAASGTVEIYNNMLFGFEYNGANPTDDVYFYGILLASPDGALQANVFHNTLLMQPLNYTGGDGWRYRGIQMNSNNQISALVKNNIIVLKDEQPEIVSYGIFRFLSAGSWTSDFNNIFVSAPSVENQNFFGRWGGANGNVTNLDEWQQLSAQDVSGQEVPVEFVSSGNLRLSGNSDGDPALAGTAAAGISTDIDGKERDPDSPYMGAWEGTQLSTSAGYSHDVAGNLKLDQNYPNPFNPVTQIRFSLPESANVTLEVFDLLGRRVAILASEQLSAGIHHITFDASGLASGVYMYRLRAGSEIRIRKMTLIQ